MLSVNVVPGSPSDAESSDGKQKPQSQEIQQTSSSLGQSMRDKIRKAKLPQAIEVSMVLRTLRDMRGEDGYIDLNNLEAREQIGTGGFGSVFLCDYHSGGKSTLVAVKQLHHALLKDPEQVRKFLSEAILARKLRHSCIVDFIGMGCHTPQQQLQDPDGASSSSAAEDATPSLLIVQEYCNGGTLKDIFMEQLGSREFKTAVGYVDEAAFVPEPYIKPTQYSYSTALSWLISITKALHYLHSASPMILHRDIKPDNILFRRETPRSRGGSSAKGISKNADLQAKIGDFGLSAMVDVKVMILRNSLAAQQQDMENLNASKARIRSFGRVQYFEAADESFNLTGRTGSVLYMAPEVMSGGKYNETCDIFSLGVIMHELMTGIPQLSHHSNFTSAAIQVHVTTTSEGARQPIPSHFPQELQSLIRRCWHQQNTHRPSALEVLAELEGMRPAIEEWDFQERKRGLFGCC